MSKIGAYIRRTARSSIRRRKRISKPGSPPSSQTGRLKKIIFQYRKSTDSVIVGPQAFNTPKIPGVLEHGGRAKIGKGKKRRAAMFKARPFMGPALDKELRNKRLMDAWANVL